MPHSPAGNCPVKDANPGTQPLPGAFALLPVVLIIVLGGLKTNSRFHQILSSPAFAFAPRLSTWLGLSQAEFMSAFLFFFLSGLPVVLSGAKAGVFSTALLIGTQTEVSLAVLILPVTRTSLWVRVLGVPFDRAVMFHRWVAWWAIGGMWAHFGLYVAKGGGCVLTTNPSSSQLGFAAVIVFSFMSIMSLNFIRRRFFEVFRSLHWLFVLAYFLLLLHTGSTALYGGAPAVLYVYDRIRRRARSREWWNVEEMVARGTVTRLTLSPSSTHPSFVYEAGQFCFINIPALSKFQWHPFSLTSHPSASTISFAIKAMGPGTWSHDLLLLAQSSSRGPTLVHVDGPFGGLSRHMDSYKSVVIVGGGIGATPCLSILQQLCAGQGGACERVTFVWTVREMSDLAWAQQALKSVEGGGGGKVKLNVRVHVTGTIDAEAHALPSLWVHRGRPNLSDVITAAKAEGEDTVSSANPLLWNKPSATAASDSASGSSGSQPASFFAAGPPGKLLVIACGPEAVIAQTQQLCLQHGVDFHSESFLF